MFTLINQNWFLLHIHNIYVFHLDMCLKLLIFHKNRIGSILVAKSKSLNSNQIISYFYPCPMISMKVFAHYGDLKWASQWHFFLYSLGTKKKDMIH